MIANLDAPIWSETGKDDGREMPECVCILWAMDCVDSL